MEETLKLDYSIESPQERAELVRKIIDNTPSEQLTDKYLTILADYIIFAADKEEKKERGILTENRLITINKRETSFEGLVEQLENGEDGIYSMITNDKNMLLTQKISITQKDLDEIPDLRKLRDAIEEVEKIYKTATGKRKFLLKKQIIEMRQNQYIIKSAFRQPIPHCVNVVRGFSQIEFDDKIEVDENGVIHDHSPISFFNPKHISVLLCNYSKLKEDTWDKMNTDGWCIIQDLENLIDRTLKDKFPLYYDLMTYKIDGKQNAEIQALLERDYQTTYSVEYISSLWRNKIPKLIAEQAEKDYLIWYYTFQEKGKWKKCSRCGEIKLAHSKFFSHNKDSKDHFYSQCKACRNEKYRLDKKDNLK